MALAACAAGDSYCSKALSDLSGKNQAMADIAKTQGGIAKQEAMKDPAALSAAEEKLRAGGKSNPTPQEIAEQAGRTAMEQYGTGSDMQRAIQAATAAAQGLAGGDMTAALAGAAAPYVAKIIGHGMGLDEKGREAEKAAAHAVANAVLAAMQGKDALAGAAGALAGELAGSIALQLYDKDLDKLDETEKQTISALATLAAGIAGGVAGDGTASAIAGAQAGKTVVENNLMAGSEDAQVAWLQQHGTNMTTCSDNPSGTECQKAQNEANAVAFAMASAGLIYLPGGMQVTSGIGGVANAGVQYLVNGEINPTDVLIASYVGAFTANTGGWGTVGWNAAGGATSNYFKGDDPFTGAAWGALGASAGYLGGKYLIQTPLNKILNPSWKSYEWVSMDMGISKPMLFDVRPAVWGGIFSSSATEGVAQGGPKLIELKNNGESK
ncbi:VENN motif pre-toxin domain-containing protein [Enterobacter sp. ECC-175]|uniref:VENN motif pre-toxin domain-containing protein n=1 Tax=unclassified Enterobacter TaxID=2608935 RepID=UPI0015EC1AEA|nr:VENN motif pre-toxin domain-containing protein [Enterobacter sp. RIT 418]